MLIFSDIINKTDFNAVWSELKAQYEGIDEYRETYEAIYRKLKEATPAPNDSQMSIVFRLEPDLWAENEDDEPYLHAYGMVPGDDEGYAIGVKRPDQIMGLFVSDETAASYSPEQIASQCIVEITYYSSAANATWGSSLDTYAGGLYASQSCIEGDDGSLSIDALREQLGVKPEKDKDDRFNFFQF